MPKVTELARDRAMIKTSHYTTLISKALDTSGALVTCVTPTGGWLSLSPPGRGLCQGRGACMFVTAPLPELRTAVRERGADCNSREHCPSRANGPFAGDLSGAQRTLGNAMSLERF